MTIARNAALHAALLFGTMSAITPASAQSPTGTNAVFDPPEGAPMLLTRTLRRELSDGKAIVATRRYRLSFIRSSDGWTIDGTLVASEIDAPPALAALATIERQRPDEGLFPMRLDERGLIKPRDRTAPPDNPSWRTAIDLATKRVSTQIAPADDAARGLLAQQMQTVAGAATLSLWPTTLFLPDTDASREERRFALPEGGEGLIVTESQRLPADGVDTMGQAERTVVTEVAGSRRVTREQWSLRLIGG